MSKRTIIIVGIIAALVAIAVATPKIMLYLAGNKTTTNKSAQVFFIKETLSLKELAKLLKEEKPLALYVFSKDTMFSDYILNNTTSGTSVVNDCLIQFGHSNLPFGGVNNSGIGKSGGLFGFQEFSNQKSVLKQYTNLLNNFYPPYTFKTKWLIEQVLKWF